MFAAESVRLLVPTFNKPNPASLTAPDRMTLPAAALMGSRLLPFKLRGAETVWVLTELLVSPPVNASVLPLAVPILKLVAPLLKERPAAL